MVRSFHRGRAALVLAAVGLCPALAPAGPARAQGPGSSAPQEEVDLERVVAGVVDLLFALADNGSDKVFQFLETVELFDFEKEIDRLVGDPRTLNDSTAYKLGLLPFHIRFPIYQQLVRQMTRQDELRSQRIHHVTPDAVNVIALRIGSLAEEDVREEVRTSLAKHFTAREVADLGFFILAQQRFFPDTDEGWQYWKRSMAEAGPQIAAAALVTGAAFDVAALSRSGTVVRLLDGQLRLGWYGGFRRLGMRFRPIMRAGATLHLSTVLELALGMSQTVRPKPVDPGRALEFAVREGWTTRWSQAWGWDAFFEGAFRYVLEAPAVYEGEDQSARLGFFARRDEIPGWQGWGLRLSAESETDFEAQVRFAVGVGLEHAPSGLTTMIQASRSARPGDRLKLADTRAGIFVAGTMEALTRQFVDRMRSNGRLVSDDWEMIATLERRRRDSERELQRLGTPGGSLAAARAALEAIDRSLKEQEARLGSMGGNLAEYLESRRAAYSLKHWPARDGDLHGPLAPEVLAPARDKVFLRLQELAAQLQKTAGRLETLHERLLVVQERMAGLQRMGASAAAITGYEDELSVIEVRLQRESGRAEGALQAYLQARECARRIKAASPRALAGRDDDPLPTRDLRRVVALKTLALPALSMAR
jgi:hypothetical protein